MYLNQKAKTTFDPYHESTLRMVRERVRESSLEECKLLIDHKVAAWRRDPKMREFLRPKTLFGKANFENYRGGIRMLKIGGVTITPAHVRGKTKVWNIAGRAGQIAGLKTDEGLVTVYWRDQREGGVVLKDERPAGLFLNPPKQFKLEGL